PRGTTWPPLGELVRSGQRVIVFSEHAGGSPDWYLPQHRYVDETSTVRTQSSAFGCEIEKGEPSASLLLSKHWISTLPPDRANATEANSRASVLAHVERCQQARGRSGAIVVVDFSSIGDVVGGVHELNQRIA